MSEWHSYIAGFFDGEGWVSIARVAANGRSDYHKIVVGLSQRTKHAAVLDRIRADFGGSIRIANQKTRLAGQWAEQSIWMAQSKPDIERFFLAIQPHTIIKAEQVNLGLDFVRSFRRASNLRDSTGHIRGMMLSREEIERRERIRLAMRDLNQLGPPRVKPSTLPPLNLNHRDRSLETFEDALVSHGEDRYNARLTENDVRAIRADFAAGAKKAEIARQHGVTFMTITKVVRRQTWAHVV